MPLSLPIIAARPPSAPRSAGDARGIPRSPARRRRRRTSDRPSAAARRSSCGSAPSRRGRRRRWSSSPGSARIRRPASPAIAGTSMAMPRAWPSLRVAAASLLTKVASTAASSGACSSTTPRKPVVDGDQPLGERRLVVGRRPSRRRGRSAGCPRSSTTPQPVRRSPGSMPRMRIGVLIAAVDSARRGRRAPPNASSRLSKPLARRFPDLRRDRPSRRRRFFRRRSRDLACVVGALGARLLRLRLGADLRAADQRGLRSAHRRRPRSC